MPTKLSEHKESSEALTILGVGPSGSGKSIGLCSFASAGPLYNISLDDRMRSVKEYYRGTELFDNIYVDVLTNFKELDEIVDKLEYDCPYKTIMIDPLTQLATLLRHYSYSLRGFKGVGSLSPEGDGAKGKKKGIVDLSTYDDINVEHSGIEQLLANLKIVQKKWGCNIILTAHLLSTTYYKVGGTVSHTTNDILTSGRKIAVLIPTMFDEIYYFYTETNEGKTDYKIRTFNDGITAARSSFVKMPKEIVWTDSLNLYGFISKFYGGEKQVKVEGEEVIV